MAHSGYIGGNLSFDERKPLIADLNRRETWRRHDLGVRHQCRCGATVYLWLRKRFYCLKCGRWIKR
jgi:hypothetical protein